MAVWLPLMIIHSPLSSRHCKAHPRLPAVRRSLPPRPLCRGACSTPSAAMSWCITRPLETTDILKDLGIQEQLIGFCHGDYNQHNVIFSREGIAVVHFENFLYQESVGDLANFIRKMMEKNNWNAGLGMDLIRGYDRVRKLSPEELKYLYVYLAYPEKFWKIANRYYNSHKAWLSGRNIEKLEKVVAQEDAREQFLQMLFHFTV